MRASHAKELARLFTLFVCWLKRKSLFLVARQTFQLLIFMSVFAVLRWFNFNLSEWPSDVNPEASEWFFLLLMWQQGMKARGGLHHSYSVLPSLLRTAECSSISQHKRVKHPQQVKRRHRGGGDRLHFTRPHTRRYSSCAVGDGWCKLSETKLGEWCRNLSQTVWSQVSMMMTDQH